MSRPLAVRLIAIAVCLLAVAAAVITGASGLVARGYLTGQADQQLRAYAGSLTRHPFEVNPLGGLSPGTLAAGASAFSIEVRGPGGQLVLRAAPGSRPAQVLPRAAARAGQLVTATAAGGDSWRLITEPIRYQARRILFAYSPQDFSLLVTSHGRAGVAGTLVVGIDLASVGRAVGRLVVTGLAVSGAAVLMVACLGILLIRVLSRPAAPPAETGDSGRPDEQPGRALADTLAELRRPVSVIHGLARDHRWRGALSAADADRMMARVAGEAQRMEALLAGLPPPGDEPAGNWPPEE
jgi:two-component system, OmpR family, sensor kinase